MPDESFYLLHDDFDAEAPGGVRWRVCPILVRSIERWCSQIHHIEPIDRQFITDRLQVQQHFDRWCHRVPGLDPVERVSPHTIAMELLCQHLLTMLRRYPRNPTIQRHWIAFFMHRCVAMGWKIWRSTPQQMQSFSLFQEIVTFGHRQITNFSEVNPLLANFNSDKSQLVSGLTHVTAYLDRQIKYSLLPDLRKILGEPNFGRSNLGVASRYSLSAIENGLKYAQLANIEEYLILWKCFSIYKKETGISVNSMTEGDFQTIAQSYQIRSTQAIDFLKGIDVKTRLEQIGNAVRQSMLCQPLYLDAEINESQSLADTIPDNGQDLLEYQMALANWEIINIETDRICNSVCQSDFNPSDQQLFWLYYGLELTQSQIGRILQDNFQLNPNPGSVSLRLSNAHKHLFDRIHTALKIAPSLSKKKEINKAMNELLEHYFDLVISQHVFDFTSELKISPRAQILIEEKTRLIEILNNWFRSKLHQLHLPSELLTDTTVQIIERYFYQP